MSRNGKSHNDGSYGNGGTPKDDGWQKTRSSDPVHRLRNVLAVVRGIVRRTGETSQSVDSFASHVDGRISAYGRILSDLLRDDSASLELGYLVAEQLMEFGAREGEQVSVDGPPVRLIGKAAETFGLAVHELALNALEHGALSVPQGRLDIRWRIDSGSIGELDFAWRESGAPLFIVPERRGFGLDLLERTLAYELGARVGVTFSGDELVWSITLPRDRVQAGPAIVQEPNKS